jgi:hypothetical protein
MGIAKETIHLLHIAGQKKPNGVLVLFTELGVRRIKTPSPLPPGEG